MKTTTFLRSSTLRATAEKFDLCFLKLAYVYNELGRYADALDVLTSRRFHMWEGGGGQIEPFIAACIGLGKAAMEKGDYAEAIRRFEQSVSYPDNLQAAKPNNAGVEPRSRYYIAQCRKALGDAAGCRAELEKALESWILAGEMDYWRVKALRELGREAECAPLIAELRQAIRELETPPPTVINAYAKFAGENSAMERAAKARLPYQPERRHLCRATAACEMADGRILAPAVREAVLEDLLADAARPAEVSPLPPLAVDHAVAVRVQREVFRMRFPETVDVAESVQPVAAAEVARRGAQAERVERLLRMRGPDGVFALEPGAVGMVAPRTDLLERRVRHGRGRHEGSGLLGRLSVLQQP